MGLPRGCCMSDVHLADETLSHLPALSANMKDLLALFRKEQGLICWPLTGTSHNQHCHQYCMCQYCCNNIFFNNTNNHVSHNSTVMRNYLHLCLNPRANDVGLCCKLPPQSLIGLLPSILLRQSMVPLRHQLSNLRSKFNCYLTKRISFFQSSVSIKSQVPQRINLRYFPLVGIQVVREALIFLFLKGPFPHCIPKV